jgi:hypothetical protein
MDRVIIIMSPIELGFLVTGKRGGLPMVGRESGFQAIGSTALNAEKIV